MNLSYLFSLPLLTKELIEQAQHKRTYILRVIYAVVLYSLALWQYNVTIGGASGFANLGRGREFFWPLISVQVLAIMLLLPAITCGAVTVEKEKDTLALLLLTKLSPWTIVFEKLLSRIFAMGTYQLLSLPLFGIVQSMGGVELWQIVAAILGLMILTIAVGSISILCSTWFRTTTEAFIMAYLSVYCTSFVAFSVLLSWMRSVEIRTMGLTPGAGSTVVEQILVPVGCGVVSLIFSGLILVLASKVLVSRAFVPNWNVVLVMFQRADRFFNDLNAKTTGGIVLVPDRATLPLFQPISWRETRKKSLGTFRYQFRVLMLLLAPLILVIASVMTDARMEFSSPFRTFPVLFWSVAVICVTIHATGVVPAERIRQSLDVLLVAPLTADEIVMEKLAGVRRLIKVLSVPFALLIIFQAIWTGYIQQELSHAGSMAFWPELITASISVVVYMPLIMWIGFQFGVRMKTQIQAVLCTFMMVVGICIIPLILARSMELFVRSRHIDDGATIDLAATFVSYLSPIRTIIDFDHPVRGYLQEAPADATEILLKAQFATINFVIYAILWYLLRRNAIRSFSTIVRRLEPDNN